VEEEASAIEASAMEEGAPAAEAPAMEEGGISRRGTSHGRRGHHRGTSQARRGTSHRDPIREEKRLYPWMKHGKAPTMRRGVKKDSTRQGTGEDTICGETKVWDTLKLKKGRSEARRERKKMRRHTFHLVKSWEETKLEVRWKRYTDADKEGRHKPKWSERVFIHKCLILC
jgi:hypothetical protein